MPATAVAALSIVLCGAAAAHAQAAPEWRDPSPHTRRLVQVEPGVDVEVLDWGGTGRPLVLLAQLGSTAHVYDGWAPSLTSTFHVYAVTRRGYGDSGPVGATLSMDRLARDIVAAFDALGLKAPVLTGHGFAGEEVTWVASRYPDRVGGVVYLDAAYDRTRAGTEAPIARRIPPRVPTPRDLSSASAFAQWASTGLGGTLPEAEVRQIAVVAPDGRLTGERTPATLQRQMVALASAPEYGRIRVPVLAIYARQASAESLPGCGAPLTDDVRPACRELFEWTIRHLEEGKTQLEAVKSGREIRELPGANAFLFLTRGDDIREALTGYARTLK
jgi:pimeloyl-ACP methyl ester carboxylesterase